MTIINTNTWERSSVENWASPSNDSLQMLQNLNHDYIVSNIQYTNYVLNSDVTVKTSDDDGIGVVFDFIDSNNYKYIMYQGGGLTSTLYGRTEASTPNAVILVDVVDGVHTRIAENPTFSFWAIGSTFNIKLENVFDDIVFYVDDNEAIRYKKQNTVTGKIGFVTYSQIADFNNIQMYQGITNRFKAKYILYAIGDSDCYTEIEVRVGNNSDILTEISSSVNDHKDIPTDINIMHRGNSDIVIEIQPVVYANMETEIEVRPHNRMTAIYEVQQPPIVTTVVNPVQDSFTRAKTEYQSINYGTSSSLVVGQANGDIWRSFVQFDTSIIQPSFRLTESYLRLYYKNVAPTQVNLEILNADAEWDEQNITDLNRPNPIKLITNEFTVNLEHGYVEFDVMKIVEDWVALRTVNNGFFIRVANETENSQATFYSRETIKPPELTIKYYDERIFSQGRSQVVTELFVYKRINKDIWAVIEPNPIDHFSTYDTEIYCHRYEVPLENDIETEIIASKPYIGTEIVSAIADVSDKDSEISIRVSDDRKVDAEVCVSTPTRLVEITPAYRRTLEEDAVIIISVPQVYVEIVVPTYNEVITEIEINSDFRSNVLVEIIVNKEAIATEISSRVGRNNDLYTEITATQDKVYAEIEIGLNSEIWVEIEANIKSDVSTEITVSVPNVLTSIAVALSETNDIETIIDAKSVSQILADIYVRFNDDINTEIDTKKISQIATEITSSKPFTNVEITIPIWTETTINTEILPRILMVNNVFTVIQVGSKGGAYAFII